MSFLYDKLKLSFLAVPLRGVCGREDEWARAQGVIFAAWMDSARVRADLVAAGIIVNGQVGPS